MLMVVYIVIHLKLLENGLWKNLGKIFNVEFLGFSHWFMSIRISQVRYHSISVDQARYATSVVDKYLDTAKFNTSTIFNKTTFPYDMIFVKDDVSTNY